MKELARKNTVRDVRRALTTLPNELDDFHHEAIRRIESQNRDDRQLAEKILLWVSYTLRTLSYIATASMELLNTGVWPEYEQARTEDAIARRHGT